MWLRASGRGGRSGPSFSVALMLYKQIDFDALLLSDDALEEYNRGVVKRSARRRSDVERASRRVLVATIRGSLIGFVLRGGFAAASALSKSAKKRSRTLNSRGNGTVTLVSAGVEAGRWACFLGTFSAIFTSADEIIGHWLGKEEYGHAAIFKTL